MMLPRYMLATTPQKMSGFLVSRSGPGVTPCRISAPSRSAMTTLAGSPRVRSGMKADWAAELLAASGAATPSIAPVPNRSGCLATRFSTA